MTGHANKSHISAYLTEVKELVSNGEYDFVPRRKNMQSLAHHGLTLIDAKEEILGLVFENYYMGPKGDFDTDRPGDVWEFKKIINGTRFYIKLKITEENGEKVLKCLGFHEEEFA